MTLYIGTSGWAYPEWKPHFYPARMSSSRFLSHYATRFSACEVNATFYRAHERSIVERWAAQVPESFRFALKAHRVLTHGKSIAPDERRRERLTEFLEETAGLGSRRGPILFQLPAYRKLDLDALRALLQRLPSGPGYAFEFRDDSWRRDGVTEAIVEAGGTVCYASSAAAPPTELPPGRLAYVRMRAERYPERTRAAWRKLLEREAAKRDIYLFTKHEGGPLDDSHFGLGLGLWLQRYGRQPTRSLEDARSSSNHTDVA